MHPSFLDEIARYRQAELLHDAERERLVNDLSMASDRPRRRRFRLRRRGATPASSRPAYGG
jgi:hypothetical protein